MNNPVLGATHHVVTGREFLWSLREQDGKIFAVQFTQAADGALDEEIGRLGPFDSKPDANAELLRRGIGHHLMRE